MKGIPASPGIAMGRFMKLDEEVAVIDRCTIENTEEEIRRFDEAVGDSLRQVCAVTEAVRRQGHQAEAQVFEAHQLMLEDPEWQGRIRESIGEQRLKAEAAVDDVTREFVTLFENLDDEYLRARAADLKDISGRVIRNLMGIKGVDLASLEEPVILGASDLTPSDTALLKKDYVLGFVTALGNKTSHTAIIARTMGIPAIVGLPGIMDIEEGEILAIDGESGEVWVAPTAQDQEELIHKLEFQEKDRQELEKVRGQRSQTADGFMAELGGNIGKPENVRLVLDNDGEGIGLFRSEFLFMDRETPPTEDEQFQAYLMVVKAMGHRPVVIRTLDAGGDKHIPYLNTGEEMNPFLGWRAIRICLSDTDLFITQLRAILRASAHGNVKIMFPMIATMKEWRRAKALVAQVQEQLDREGIPYGSNLEIGIMVEVPSTAVLAEVFAREVDFFSIGTNDLTQYMLAADRMNARLEDLYSTFDPAVLRMIHQVIKAGNAAGKWVGMCGEAAGDLKMIPLLIAMGLKEFSMAPGSILKARRLIMKLDKAALQPLLEEIMAMDDANAIEEKMRQFLKTL